MFICSFVRCDLRLLPGALIFLFLAASVKKAVRKRVKEMAMYLTCNVSFGDGITYLSVGM